jgi:tetratricopeptide (TPR) repeat protein
MSKKKQSNTKHFFRSEWKLIIGVLLLTFFAYANALQNDWAYDDWFQVARNAQVTSWSNVPKTFTQSVWQFMDESSKEPRGVYYRPIFNSFLIVQYQLFGQKVWAWHLVSVLLHLIVVLLVYVLARVWDLDKTIAAIAALIFGLHPVHVEVVAWISSSPDLIAGIFVLASLLSYEKARGAHIQLRRSWMCASLVFALLAMFTKEQAIMLPLIIAAREFFDKEKSISQTALRASLFIIPAVCYLAMRYYVLGFLLKPYENNSVITLKQVLLTIPFVTLSYAKMLFVPYPLMIVYDHTYVQSISDTRFLFPLFIVMLIFALVIWLIKSSLISLRSLAFLVFFLLPVLNLRVFNVNESLVHDRYLYLPSIGFCFVVAYGLAKLNKKTLVATISVIAVVFFALTFFQNRTWRDDYALFNHALKFTTKKPFLYVALANAYNENNQFNEAEKVFLKSIEVAPTYGVNYSGLGYTYTKLQRHEDAVKAFEQAIEYVDPANAADYFNLGSAYIQIKKFDEAEKALLKAIEIYPQYAPAHYNLGWLYQQQGRKDLAAKHYQIALELQPKPNETQ